MERDSMVARGSGSFSSDDSCSQCSVDLGLGFGRKPGGLPKSDDTISSDFETFSSFRRAPSPTIKQIDSGEALEKDEERRNSLTWRNSLQDCVEQLRETGGLSPLSRISNWSLPKRSFSLKLRNRTSSEGTTQNEDKVNKENIRGLRRVNSTKGKLKCKVKYKVN